MVFALFSSLKKNVSLLEGSCCRVKNQKKLVEFPLPLLQQMCWRWCPPLYLFITHQNSRINKPQAAPLRFPKHSRQPSYSSHRDLWIRLKWWCTDFHSGPHQARLFPTLFFFARCRRAVRLQPNWNWLNLQLHSVFCGAAAKYPAQTIYLARWKRTSYSHR